MDLERYDHTAPCCTLKGEYGMDDDAVLVGVVGRLELEKGHPTLLEAWPLVLADVPCAYLIIVGEGSRQDALHQIAREQGIERHVVFTGRRDDIPEITAALDVAVLPSYREAQGLSILEAMALARPVVASNVGGIPEMVEHGVTGLLSAPRSLCVGGRHRAAADRPPAGGHGRPRGARPGARPVLHPADGQRGADPVRRRRTRGAPPRDLDRGLMAAERGRGSVIDSRPVRIASLLLAGLFVALWLVSLIVYVARGDLAYQGADYQLYMDATARWLSGGPFYEPAQLAGPYPITHGAILYPLSHFRCSSPSSSSRRRCGGSFPSEEPS